MRAEILASTSLQSNFCIPRVKVGAKLPTVIVSEEKMIILITARLETGGPTTIAAWERHLLHLRAKIAGRGTRISSRTITGFGLSTQVCKAN